MGHLADALARCCSEGFSVPVTIKYSPDVVFELQEEGRHFIMQNPCIRSSGGLDKD